MPEQNSPGGSTLTRVPPLMSRGGGHHPRTGEGIADHILRIANLQLPRDTCLTRVSSSKSKLIPIHITSSISQLSISIVAVESRWSFSSPSVVVYSQARRVLGKYSLPRAGQDITLSVTVFPELKPKPADDRLYPTQSYCATCSVVSWGGLPLANNFAFVRFVPFLFLLAFIYVIFPSKNYSLLPFIHRATESYLSHVAVVLRWISIRWGTTNNCGDNAFQLFHWSVCRTISRLLIAARAMLETE